MVLLKTRSCYPSISKSFLHFEDSYKPKYQYPIDKCENPS